MWDVFPDSERKKSLTLVLSDIAFVSPSDFCMQLTRFVSAAEWKTLCKFLISFLFLFFGNTACICCFSPVYIRVCLCLPLIKYLLPFFYTQETSKREMAENAAGAMIISRWEPMHVKQVPCWTIPSVFPLLNLMSQELFSHLLCLLCWSELVPMGWCADVGSENKLCSHFFLWWTGTVAVILLTHVCDGVGSPQRSACMCVMELVHLKGVRACVWWSWFTSKECVHVCDGVGSPQRSACMCVMELVHLKGVHACVWWSWFTSKECVHVCDEVGSPPVSICTCMMKLVHPLDMCNTFPSWTENYCRLRAWIVCSFGHTLRLVCLTGL